MTVTYPALPVQQRLVSVRPNLEVVDVPIDSRCRPPAEGRTVWKALIDKSLAIASLPSMQSRIAVEWGAVTAMAMHSAGCILPIDCDLAVSGTAARELARGDYTTVGGAVSGDLRPGTDGLVLGGEASVAAAVDRSAGVQPRVLGLAGYAAVPRPFEGHWGVSGEGVLGYSRIPLPGGVVGALPVGGRVSILYRLTPSHRIWTEDLRTTPELFLALGGQGLALWAPAAHGVRFEAQALLDLMITWYSNGAP